MSAPQSYEIRTLVDIYNLPTVEAMERCLKELAELMVSARATEELLAVTARSLAEKDGPKLPEGRFYQWPEVSTWTDDGGLAGSEIKFAGSAGEEPLLVLSITKNDKGGAL